MDPVSLPDQDNTLYRKIQTFLKINVANSFYSRWFSIILQKTYQTNWSYESFGKIIR